MENALQPKIDNYLDLLDKIKAKVQDERTAVSLLSEICKDNRMEQMRKEREQQASEPASRKQIQYLKKLGVDIHEYPKLTKEQASKLIDEVLDE
jgi:hypothetical protein